ncbi:MAG: phosphotransferase family protein [Rhodospirillales bacterium]|nr:phosphotransferase family protein [Rhodospirillales bacterium]MDH3912036.1 phosphotransferase family protein [Rhodospirillales bacterium]
MADDPELIDVRSDERLDLTRLEPYLRARLPGAEGPLELRQFGGGHANLTYLLGFGDTEYVLRRPPLGPIAPSSHDMAREHRVLAALSRVFPLAPRSYLLCDDPEILGALFHVMERRQGIVIRTDPPEEIKGDATLNRRIGEMMVDVLAALHGVDSGAAGLGDLGRPEGFVGRQLDGWTRRWHAAKQEDVARMDAVVAWLEGALPASKTVSLLHNDYKLDNMMVGAEDAARAVAVFDWDMCTRGDPLMDLGYLLTFWGEADDDPAWILGASMPTWHHGFPSREAAVERYARATGFDCGAVHWYHVFGVFKIAVVLQQIYIRYLRGQTRDRRFAVFGERIAALIDKAATLAGV